MSTGCPRLVASFSLLSLSLAPRTLDSLRRQSFLSLPVSWTLSAWSLHPDGTLAVSTNDDAMEMDILTTLFHAMTTDR